MLKNFSKFYINIAYNNRLYIVLFTACCVGYVWLYYNIATIEPAKQPFVVCLIKQTTNIPCPSCGTTRSVISLTKGNFTEALYTNPLGYLVLAIMLILPLWIIVDVITKRDTLFKYYHKIELKLKKPQYFIPLILIMLINWVWNITKAL